MDMSRSRGLASGVVRFEPDELVVTVGAGTTMDELAAVLASHRQRLRIPTIGTVGGVLATRRNGPFPSDNSALPNIALQIKAVDGIGREFVAGGGTVKNVSGFDLVKLLVGSWGTLATITEAILRTEPIPACSRWFLGEGDVRSLYRPALVAQSRNGLCVNLEGHPDDVATSRGVVWFQRDQSANDRGNDSSLRHFENATPVRGPDTGTSGGLSSPEE